MKFGRIDDNGSSVPQRETITQWETRRESGIVCVKRAGFTDFPPDDLTIEEWVEQVEEARKAREARNLKKELAGKVG